MSAPAVQSQWQITRRLFDLAWPIVGLNVLTVLALAVDTAMVGRVPEAEAALTGMGYASQLVFLLMVAMIGLTVGTVALIARAKGIGDRDRVGHVLHQSTQLAILLGLVVAVLGNLAARPLMTALGAEGVGLEEGLRYLRPLLTGVVFSNLNILYGAAARGVGNTRLPFATSFVANVLNFLFNYGLILGNYGLPALGVQGAAIGTVLSQAVGVVLMVVLLRQGYLPDLRPRLRVAPVDRPLARELVSVGWPAATDMIVLNAGFLSIIGMLGRIDQAAVAAHGVGLRVQALAFVPGMSVSQATGALVGNALGAGSVETARRVVRSGIALNLVVMSSLAALLYFWAGPLVSLFDVPAGTPMHDFSVMWMKVLGWCMPFVGIYITFVGLLQGAGSTKLSLRINSVATLVFQIPASYVLGFVLGLGAFGVWVAFPLSFVVKLLWGAIEYRRERWAKLGLRAS